VAGSIAVEVIFFYLIFGIDSICNRKKYYKIFLEGRSRAERKAKNLTAIINLILGKCGIFEVSKTYGPSPPVTWRALFFLVHRKF
jgi:hypothetical protein